MSSIFIIFHFDFDFDFDFDLDLDFDLDIRRLSRRESESIAPKKVTVNKLEQVHESQQAMTNQQVST